MFADWITLPHFSVCSTTSYSITPSVSARPNAFFDCNASCRRSLAALGAPAAGRAIHRAGRSQSGVPTFLSGRHTGTIGGPNVDKRRASRSPRRIRANPDLKSVPNTQKNVGPSPEGRLTLMSHVKPGGRHGPASPQTVSSKIAEKSASRRALNPLSCADRPVKA